MPVWLTDHEHAVVAAAADRLIPPHDGHPGGRAAGVADYVDQLLGAFSFDPPRVWAGGPYSGRAGGEAGFADFLPLSRLEELAWRTRIEGSLGLPERERNGPLIGFQERYRAAVRALGADFCEVDGDEQDARLARDPEFRSLLYEHACEGVYGAPEYGGNPVGIAWAAIAYEGDVQPRGYTDQEVSGRE